MHIACSTLCFASRPLEEALELIASLEFTQVEVGLIEGWAHINPSEVAADVTATVRRIRSGPGLNVVAFNVEIKESDQAAFLEQLHAVCRVAKMLTATCITVPTAPADTPLEAEVERLTQLVRCTMSEGVTLCIENRVGTLAERPETAVQLCRAVPHLGLTLDPSYYLYGPNQGRDYSIVFPYVQHVRFRDSGLSPDQSQVPVGQGKVNYSKILLQLQRYDYERVLSVQFFDEPNCELDLLSEVHKLKLVLESLV